MKAWVKDPFAGDKKIITINKKYGFHKVIQIDYAQEKMAYLYIKILIKENNDSNGYAINALYRLFFCGDAHAR